MPLISPDEFDELRTATGNLWRGGWELFTSRANAAENRLIAILKWSFACFATAGILIVMIYGILLNSLEAAHLVSWVIIAMVGIGLFGVFVFILGAFATALDLVPDHKAEWRRGLVLQEKIAHHRSGKIVLGYLPEEKGWTAHWRLHEPDGSADEFKLPPHLWGKAEPEDTVDLLVAGRRIVDVKVVKTAKSPSHQGEGKGLG
jgi:ABC-type multidrug transport system fused ATPase/permease subunit